VGGTGGESYSGYLRAIETELLATLPEAFRDRAHARLRERRATATDPAPPSTTSAPTAVRAWTLAELLPQLERASRGRSFASGRAAYQAAQCHACHPLAGIGGARGPDLTAVANRFTRRDLLEAILQPSQAISDQYANVEITTRDAQRFVGRVLEENAEHVVLDVDAFREQRVTVPRASVAARSVSRLSPMPEGLLGGLNLEQVLDLLAFLEAGGQQRGAAFEKR
jgi:putative heme-binding domain-containing protein